MWQLGVQKHEQPHQELEKPRVDDALQQDGPLCLRFQAEDAPRIHGPRSKLLWHLENPSDMVNYSPDRAGTRGRRAICPYLRLDGPPPLVVGHDLGGTRKHPGRHFVVFSGTGFSIIRWAVTALDSFLRSRKGATTERPGSALVPLRHRRCRSPRPNGRSCPCPYERDGRCS